MLADAVAAGILDDRVEEALLVVLDLAAVEQERVGNDVGRQGHDHGADGQGEEEHTE